MYCNFPSKIQRLIIEHLSNNNFVKAKEIYEQYKANCPEVTNPASDTHANAKE